jgi:E3 ubiquitin-protein ligase BRE1
MEGLSKLCDETTKTMSQKTYELKDSELKMSRLATEVSVSPSPSAHTHEQKAKANNKYFAAMQTKEVLEQETRSMQRTVDKQSVLLQKAQEVERGLNAQIVSCPRRSGSPRVDAQAAHEKGLIALKNSSLDLQSQLAQIASEKAQLEHRLSQAQATLAEVSAAGRAE